jgi:hypothetical protein
VATFHSPERLAYPPGRTQREKLLARIDSLTAVGDATAEAARERFPGDYRVVAQRTWVASLRKPGTTDDAEQGEQVTVRANQVATVNLVVESTSGVITGTVVDAAGAPVNDAFISAARESDAAGAQKTAATQTRWSWDEKPVLTSTDGSFTVSKLSPLLKTNTSASVPAIASSAGANSPSNSNADKFIIRHVRPRPQFWKEHQRRSSLS